MAASASVWWRDGVWLAAAGGASAAAIRRRNDTFSFSLFSSHRTLLSLHTLKAFSLSPILLLSSLALVVARLALVVAARLSLITARLARPFGFCCPLWQLSSRPFGLYLAASLTATRPLGRQFTVHSLSCLCEWTTHIKITHGVTYRCLEACCLSTLEALLSVWQTCICSSHLTLVWLTKEGDIRRSGSWFQSKKGRRPQSSKNSSGPSRRWCSRTISNPYCHNLSNKHDIPVAGERTHLERMKTKGKKARKKRDGAVRMRWTKRIKLQEGPSRYSG